MINPPAAKKYQYWTNDADDQRHRSLARKARPSIPAPGGRIGIKWLSKLSGEKVPARKPGDGKLKVLGDAPGTYVKVKAQ